MKIRFLRNVTADVETRHGEFSDKAFARWAEIRVDSIYPYGKFVTIKLENGDILHGIPSDSFEKLEEIKRTVMI